MDNLIKFLSPVALILFTYTTQAASFDCKKAVTYQEKFICSNKAVDDADSKMGTAYQEARKKIPLKGYVASDQKYWLRHVYKTSCASDSKKPLQEQINSCLRVLDERVIELRLMSESAIYTNYEGNFTDGEDQGTLQIFEEGKNITLKYQGGQFRTLSHISYCWGSFDLIKSGNKYFNKNVPEITKLIKNKDSIELLEAIYGCDGPSGQLPADKYILRK